jgi:hypothetical protein
MGLQRTYPFKVAHARLARLRSHQMTDLQADTDRREGERRSTERRESERRDSERRDRERRRYDPHGVRVATSRGSRQNLLAALWALIGAIVVVYLFFLVLGDKKPGDAPVVSGIVLALAVVWLGHSWRRLVGGGAISTGDRERRGF